MIRKWLIWYLKDVTWPTVAIDVAIITVCTFSLLGLMNLDPYSILEPDGDFSSGDYYDRIYHRNVDLPVDTNIVVVATDNLKASEITETLRLVASFKPAAIGLDLIFRTQGSLSDDLIDIIDSIPNIVLPVELEYDNNSGTIHRGPQSLIDFELPDKHYASISFPPQERHATLRSFCINTELAAGDSIESFAVALSRLKNPELQVPGTPTLMINFNISTPECLSMTELINHDNHDIVRHLIEGKVVLLGDINNIYDELETSISDHMPGIMVHAAATATLLSEKHVKELSPTWMLIISFIFIVAAATISAKFDENADLTKNFALLGLKLLFIIVILVGGYWLYTHFAYRADFTGSIALLFFSMVVCDFWFPFKHFIKDRILKNA